MHADVDIGESHRQSTSRASAFGEKQDSGYFMVEVRSKAYLRVIETRRLHMCTLTASW